MSNTPLDYLLTLIQEGCTLDEEQAAWLTETVETYRRALTEIAESPITHRSLREINGVAREALDTPPLLNPLEAPPGYRAYASGGDVDVCDRCVFGVQSQCRRLGLPSCIASMREDGTDVYFRHAFPEPFSQEGI